MRRLASLLTVLGLLVFLVGLGPHLVHHVFDGHDGLTPSEACPFATAAERQHADSPVAVATHDDPDAVGAAEQAAEPAPAAIAPGPRTARAPPAS
jgi:hypothetical protein